MTSPTLAVVDMQLDFSRTASVCLHDVIREVEHAVQKNWGIVFLEYVNSGPTFKVLRSIVENYNRVAFVPKTDDDGGYELITAIKNRGFNPTDIRFCGVNRSACVISTIVGAGRAISNIGKPNFEIAINATWCNSPDYGKERLSHYGKFV